MADYTYHGWDATTPGDWSVAGNFNPSGGPPGAGDNVSIAAGANAISSGLTSGATTRLGRVHFEEGFFELAGVEDDTGNTYLKLNCAFLLLASEGKTFIELNSAGSGETTDIEVRNTAPATNGTFGAYITSETPNTDQGNVREYSQTGGSVGIATNLHDDLIITDSCNSFGGNLEIGHGCTLSTCDLRVKSSSVVMRGIWANCPTTLEAGAVLRTEGNSANANTVTLRGDSQFIPNSSSGSADIGVVAMYDDSFVDFYQSGLPRTITTFHQIGGRVRMDPAVVTITTLGSTTPFDRTVESV